jgi:hypothetical protein
VSGIDKEWVASQFERAGELLASGGRVEISEGNPDGDREEPTPRRRRARRPAAASKASGPSAVFEQLTEERIARLTAFIEERKAKFKSKQDQAAIIATFLEDELKFDGIDADDLDAVYEVMGWKKPGNARAAINNARDRNKYFRGWTNGRIHLSATGQNFGRHDSKATAE